jgi:hypothetical protein
MSRNKLYDKLMLRRDAESVLVTRHACGGVTQLYLKRLGCGLLGLCRPATFVSENQREQQNSTATCKKQVASEFSHCRLLVCESAEYWQRADNAPPYWGEHYVVYLSFVKPASISSAESETSAQPEAQ